MNTGGEHVAQYFSLIAGFKLVGLSDCMCCVKDSPPDLNLPCFRASKDRFWQAYAADRYAMLTGSGSPKYLIFEPKAGLGNRLSGMMSTFVLSVAFGRVFLHKWNTRGDWWVAEYRNFTLS